MKITKSQLRQLVMEELSEQMPEMANEAAGGSLPEVECVHAGEKEAEFRVILPVIDRSVVADGLESEFQSAYEANPPEGGPDSPDDLHGMGEAKSWKAQQRARGDAEREAALKNDPVWQRAKSNYTKSGNEKDLNVGKTYKRGHAGRGGDDGDLEEGRFGSRKQPAYLRRAQSREERSDKDAQNENRISKNALNAIIAEEYNKLTKEVRYNDWSRGGEPTGDKYTGDADRRYTATLKADKEHAARMAQKATPEQEEKLRALMRADPKNELTRAALSVISLGNILTRKNYPKIFADPNIAAIFEK